MAWITPKFRQGLDKLNTSLGNEGGHVDAHGIRFYQGGVQCIGGWTKHAAASYTGTARASLTWRTQEGVKCLGWGTDSKLYAEINGTRVDITPNLHETVLSGAFTVSSGSSTYTVTLTAHMLQVGDSVTFSNHQSTAGGRTISGTKTVASVPTPDTFTFTNSQAATSDTTLGGGLIDFVAPLPAHYPTWTLATWGENFLANPSGYGLFEFQPETTYAELIFNGTFTGNANGWALGSGYSYSSNAISASSGSASNLSQNVQGVLEAGRTYQLSVGVTRSAGSLKIQMNVGSSATPTPYSCTFALSTDKVTCLGLANQIADGMAIQFQTTGALPTGLSTSTTYYMVDTESVSGTFRVAATPGGSTIDLSGSPSGSSTVSINLPDAVVIDIGTISSPISVTGTYTRIFTCPADPSDIVFAKDSSFSGTIDNVSIKLVNRAYRITTAPPQIDAIFTDQIGIVIALGTTSLDDGQYSATRYRCSDLGNNKSWVPDTNSMATEQIVRGLGGRLMGGLNTAEQNLVGGDDGAASFVYQGVFGDAFKVTVIGVGCGWISRHCAAAVNGIALWKSNAAKYFIFGGAGIGSLGKPVPISCPIEQDVFGHLSESDWPTVHCGLNLAFQEAWFFYHDNRDSGSECTRAAVVAWTETDQSGAVPWTQHTIGRSSWVQPGTFPNPIAFGSSGGSNYVYDHESGNTADGSAIGEYIETAPFDIAEGEQLTELKRIVPDFISTVGDVQIYVKARMSPKGTLTTYGPFTATQATAFLDMRIKARQIALRLVGATTGGFWRMIAMRLDLYKTGAKR